MLLVTEVKKNLKSFRPALGSDVEPYPDVGNDPELLQSVL